VPTVAMDQSELPARCCSSARRRAEIAWCRTADFYVVTLSAHTLGYKGMVLPAGLRTFYRDLQHPAAGRQRGHLPPALLDQHHAALAAGAAVPLARAQRRDQHHRGQSHWAKARGAKCGAAAAIDLRELKPLVSLTGSDSQSLDNMLEVLLMGGMDLLQAMRMLIPPAWQSLERPGPDLPRSTSTTPCTSSRGTAPPASCCCDGRYAAARSTATACARRAGWSRDDRHLVIASEAGVWDYEPPRSSPRASSARRDDRGRPVFRRIPRFGTPSTRSTARARRTSVAEAGRAYLSTRPDRSRAGRRALRRATLARHQKLFQLTARGARGESAPLAETEQEAVGSMGDDTPMAVLSRQGRARCTTISASSSRRSPIRRSIRCAKQCVMSLSTQIGRKAMSSPMAPQNARQSC
jgi:glutamate synthase (NADPH/NADH) large chain